jgi:signal transduction histidine kinase
VDFADQGSFIKIQLDYEKHLARLDVINRGIALPAEMQERLFESMVSLRTQSQTGIGKEPHLGLGLYIVRLIASYHGGYVKATNNQEYPGAIFSVWLPGRFSDTALV